MAFVGSRTGDEAAEERQREAAARGDVIDLDSASVKPEPGAGSSSSATAAASSASPAVSGLQPIFEGLRDELDDFATALAEAMAWCHEQVDEQGYKSVQSLVEVGEQGELAAALPLKPGQRKLLIKRLEQAAAPEGKRRRR